MEVKRRRTSERVAGGLVAAFIGGLGEFLFFYNAWDSPSGTSVLWIAGIAATGFVLCCLQRVMTYLKQGRDVDESYFVGAGIGAVAVMVVAVAIDVFRHLFF